MAEGEAPESGDRTEAPTPRRLERAREEGQVALSREAVGWASLALATAALLVALPPAGAALLAGLKRMLAAPPEGGMATALAEVLRLGGLAVLPVAAAAALGGVAATLVQTGLLVSAKPLAPKLEKLSPWAGLARLFGPDALVEFLRTVIKLGVVGAALWWSLDDPARLQAALHHPAAAMLASAGQAAERLLLAALAAFAAIAVADLLWVRLRHLHRLRMSRQDLREEAKESEGDPLLRARLRALREKRSRARMMAAVPKAAVVVTNPTHYAVALAYAGGQAAPTVVAKGSDAVAARIRAAAEAAGVPCVANPPLARALFRLELDQAIPVEHYQAVAEIIAFVWRRRGPSRGQPGAA